MLPAAAEKETFDSAKLDTLPSSTRVSVYSDRLRSEKLSMMTALWPIKGADTKAVRGRRVDSFMIFGTIIYVWRVTLMTDFKRCYFCLRSSSAKVYRKSSKSLPEYLFDQFHKEAAS
jgi:hypothetical protein